MSLSPPRERNNDQARTYHLYWCFQCNRTVRLAPSNPSEIMCPRCFGQFICEINIPRPRLLVDFTTHDPSPEARLLEALSLMLEPPIRRFNDPSSNAFEPMRQNPNPIPRVADARDYFFGPGLNELIEQLTENDRPGPAPAAERTIEAIPT
ncbi:zinc-ribbon, partial [Sesbania bispinosa]